MRTKRGLLLLAIGVVSVALALLALRAWEGSDPVGEVQAMYNARGSNVQVLRCRHEADPEGSESSMFACDVRGQPHAFSGVAGVVVEDAGVRTICFIVPEAADGFARYGGSVDAVRYVNQHGRCL